MTKYTNTNGKCPHCECMFDVKKAIPAFPGNFSGMKVFIIFALCPDCYALLEVGNSTQKIAIIKKSFINFTNNRTFDWSLTNNLALNAYSDNFFDAWMYGLDLHQSVF
jgi:hypothetical protein